MSTAHSNFDNCEKDLTMTLRIQALFMICILLGMVISPAAFAQSEYDEGGLIVKRIFSDYENAALSEPFKEVFAGMACRQICSRSIRPA